MKITVLNTHSIANTGDAAISIAQLSLLREILGDTEVAVTSRTPDLDRPFYETLGVTVHPPLFAAPSVFRTPAQRIAGVSRGLLALAPKRTLAREISRSDVVISSGGGYFFSTRPLLPGPMFCQAYAHVRLAQKLRRPVIFAPQSFGPLANRFAARLMRRMILDPVVRSVMIREETSRVLVSELAGDAPQRDRITLCPDLAFLVEAPHENTAGRRLPRPVLAVTVRDWLFPDRRGGTRKAARTSYLGAVAGALIEFHRATGGGILVVAYSRGPGVLEDDRTISSDLVALLGGSVPSSHVVLADLPENATPHRVMAAMSGADFLLASRFHSAILAMISGIPPVALGYQPKSLGMMKMLGLGRLCVDMDGVETAPIVRLLNDLLAHRDQVVAEEIAPAIASMRASIKDRMRQALAPWCAP